MKSLYLSRKLAVSLGAALLALSFSGQTGNAQVGASVIVNNTGHVIATYLGNSASFSNDLFLDSPVNGLGLIFNNHDTPVGTMVDLGEFAAGTELIFRLHVNNTGDDFFTGPGSRNPDGEAHALVDANTLNPFNNQIETGVFFEDLLNGPFGFNDLGFSFSNTRPQGDVPEPGTLALLVGAGAATMLIRRRRA